MATLTDRLTEVMVHMHWTHQDVMRVSRQSSSVVSQWLGKTNKPIKSIGKLEAAIYLERATGYSALWLAKGMGPKFVNISAAAEPGSIIARQPPPRPYSPADVLDHLPQLIAAVPDSMRTAFADVLAGWVISGGTDDRRPALMALMQQAQKQRSAA